MAAADFFNPGARPIPQSNGAFLAPPQPQRASSNPNLRYDQYSQSAPAPNSYTPQASPHHSPYIPAHYPPHQPSPLNGSPYLQPQQPQQPPPPYQPEHKASISFAQPPQPQRSSFSGGQRPQYNPQHLAPVPYNPQQYGQPAPIRPNMDSNNSSYSVASGYKSDPEHHRRTHKQQTGKERAQKRRISESSRSSNTDGFLGAAGGGLIGDLIMPGLGTVGGALIGYLGGKDYGQHRKVREVKRERAQKDWETQYGSKSRERSHDGERQRSRSERRGSHSSRKDDY